MSTYRFESDFHINGMVKLVATANIITSLFQFIIYRGMVAEVARKAHYLEVGGSNPSPTTLLEDTRGELLEIVDVDKSALR